MAQDAGFLATWVPSIMISDPKTIHGLQNVLDLVDSIKASFIKMDVFYLSIAHAWLELMRY